MLQVVVIAHKFQNQEVENVQNLLCIGIVQDQGVMSGKITKGAIHTIHLRDIHTETDIAILGQGLEIDEVGQGLEIVEVGQGRETDGVDLDLGVVEVDLHSAEDQDLEKDNVLNILCTADVAVKIQAPALRNLENYPKQTQLRLLEIHLVKL